MNNINYKSDFDFLMRLYSCTTAADGSHERVYIGWPTWDWVAKFWTSTKANNVVASCVGGVMTNCYRDGDAIHIYCDNPRIGRGQLHVEFHALLPDKCYPDNTKDTYMSQALEVELVDGNPCCPSHAEVEVMLPFAVISAYDTARAAGFEGTAEEYYAGLAALPALYPQGGEKVLIYNTTGEIVPEGKLPIDVGAIVINCTTLAVIAKYIRTGMPLVEKVVTVDGSAVANPQNVIVPVGTPIQNVLDFAGLKCEPKKVLYGGPMMGTSVPSLEAPVMKNTNAVLAFDEKDAEDPVPSACIRCGRCVAHCPFNLMPAAIESAYNNKEPETLKALKVNLCMECGCCSFSCPARRPLVQVNKLAKAMLNKYNAEQKAEAEKKAAKAKEKEKEAV